jgi:hypothetical protein
MGPWTLRASVERRWIDEGRTRIAWKDFAGRDACGRCGGHARRDGGHPFACAVTRGIRRALAQDARTLRMPGDTDRSWARATRRGRRGRGCSMPSRRSAHVQPRMRPGEAVATPRDMANRATFEPLAPARLDHHRRLERCGGAALRRTVGRRAVGATVAAGAAPASHAAHRMAAPSAACPARPRRASLHSRRT